MSPLLLTAGLLLGLLMIAAYVCDHPERQNLAQQRVRLKALRGDRPNYWMCKKFFMP